LPDVARLTEQLRKYGITPERVRLGEASDDGKGAKRVQVYRGVRLRSQDDIEVDSFGRLTIFDPPTN
jgi:hypothetical protein